MSKELMNTTPNSELLDISDIKDEERIDFNRPISILEYCKDDILEINKIMTESSSLLSEDSYDSGVNARVEKIDINKLINDNDKKKDKVEKRNKHIDNNIILRGMDKILHLREKMDDTVMTASEIKRAYAENIEAVVADMRKDAEKMMRSIAINDDVNDKVQPNLDKMRRKIELGEIDKQYFIDHFIVPLENKEELTEEEQRDLTLARNLVAECDTSLNELRIGYQSIQQVLYEGQIHNSGDRRQLITLERFFNITVGLLKVKSNSIVDTYVQKERVERHQKVFDAINKTYEQSAKDLASTLEDIIKMGEENILKPETIQKVDENLNKCSQILTSATEHKQSRNTTTKKAMEIIGDHIQKYQDALKEYNAVDERAQYSFEVQPSNDTPKQKKYKRNNNQ